MSGSAPETFFVHFLDESGPDVNGLSLAQAKAIASDHVGNNNYTKPFPDEETYLYGPGDGTCYVMVRPE
jgi:hypothetical protein